MPTPPCPNCGSPRTGAYCAECGQEQGDLVPSVRAWIAGVVEELVGVDGKLAPTVAKLFWPPGELMLEWRRGRRARYIRPFRLYLAAALLLFLSWPQTAFSSALEGIAAGFLDAGAHESAAGVPDTGQIELGTRVVTESLPALLIILLVPLFGSALLVVNPAGRGYVEYMVAALHIHAVVFIVMVLTTPFPLFLGSAWEDLVLPPVLLALVAYVAAFIARVYGIGPWRALARTLVVTLVYLVAVGLVIGVLLEIVLESA